MIIFGKILLIITVVLMLGVLYNAYKANKTGDTQRQRDNALTVIIFSPYLIFISLYLLGVI